MSQTDLFDKLQVQLEELKVLAAETDRMSAKLHEAQTLAEVNLKLSRIVTVLNVVLKKTSVPAKERALVQSAKEDAFDVMRMVS